MQNSPSYRTWAGFAFEGICLKHLNQIVTGLGLSSIIVHVSRWFEGAPKGSHQKGAQIDLVIERADRCTNLCEIKYTNTPFTITKEYAEKLQWKKERFRQATQTKNSLFTTLITPYGVEKNVHYYGSVDQELTMDVLFEN